MIGGRIGLIMLIRSGGRIDLKNHTGKSGCRNQLLLSVIDKCMSAEQRGVNGPNGLLNADRDMDALLRWTLCLGFGIKKMAHRFATEVKF